MWCKHILTFEWKMSKLCKQYVLLCEFLECWVRNVAPPLHCQWLILVIASVICLTSEISFLKGVTNRSVNIDVEDQKMLLVSTASGAPSFDKDSMNVRVSRDFMVVLACKQFTWKLNKYLETERLSTRYILKLEISVYIVLIAVA